jgi:hypothetical protein
MVNRSQVDIGNPKFNRNEGTNVDRVDIVISLKKWVFEFGNGPIVGNTSVKRQQRRWFCRRTGNGRELRYSGLLGQQGCGRG